ncbi:S-layer homology domain-containing protein [Cohnella caldifontis]|uniref:S-layer homology domain-containing protein n=1 Tax=Cohnella caldifontis TaxID=3027471 RepID=UPI0023EB8A1B|nr:S-layer homology domain-containing protein [Cohnella sp. YIM B05605]
MKKLNAGEENWTDITYSETGNPGDPFTNLTSIAVDAAGNLYVADYYYQKVFKLSAGDHAWSVFLDMSGSGRPADMRFGPDGALYLMGIVTGGCGGYGGPCSSQVNLMKHTDSGLQLVVSNYVYSISEDQVSFDFDFRGLAYVKIVNNLYVLDMQKEPLALQNLDWNSGGMSKIDVGPDGAVYATGRSNGLPYKHMVNPIVSTAVPANVTDVGATAGGNVLADGGANVTERGVVYSDTVTLPTTADGKAVAGTPGSGTFSVALAGLAPETTYYVRSYATTIVGTSYGEVKTFTTLAVPPPAAPANLTAIAGDTQVTLNWIAVVGAANYSVYQGNVSGTYDSTPIATVTEATYRVTGLTNGTKYYFAVKANNIAGGSSDYSNEAAATPSAVPPPAAPANLTAVAGDSQVTLNWIAVVGAANYSVYQGNVSGTYDSRPIATVTEATYRVTGLTNGTTYYFAVKANNTVGESSAYSNEASATPAAVVTPPPSSSSGSSSPQPQTEIITVDVEDNGSGSGGVVSKATIKRTTDANGRKRDEVDFTPEQAADTVERLAAAGSKSAKIVISDAKDEVAELSVKLSKASADKLADGDIGLEINTVNVRIDIPSESLKDLKEDVYFRVVPLKTESERQEAEKRARTEQAVRAAAGDNRVVVIGRPMTIETNMQSRPVTLVLPLRDRSLTEKQLKQLGIFIEHSDGTKELVKGEIVPYDEQGNSGIRFTVRKFSTFTVIHMDAPDQVHKAYISGYPGNVFGPDQPITRAEMAALLARVMEGEAPADFAADYNDVAPTYWAVDAIAEVTSKGWMTGYPDGSFQPEQRITRAEMAGIAAKLAPGSKTQAPAASSFTDAQGHWAENAIRQAAAVGILSGYKDGTFRPGQNLTRAEAVTILNRLLDRHPSAEEVAPQWSDVPKRHWAYDDIQEASVDHAFEITSAGDERWIPSK